MTFREIGNYGPPLWNQLIAHTLQTDQEINNPNYICNFMATIMQHADTEELMAILEENDVLAKILFGSNFNM